jgi:hypothetical protein
VVATLSQASFFVYASASFQRMRWLVGSRLVACSYFEMAVSMSVPLALSPSFARLTASMLLRLQPSVVAPPLIAAADPSVTASTTPIILFMAAASVRERRELAKGKTRAREERRPGRRENATRARRERD